MSFGSLLFAQTKNGIDLEAVMKQMRFEYNKTMKSDSTAVFNKHLNEFKKQLGIAQQFPFNEQRIEKATQGLDKVAKVVNQLNKPTTLDELNKAKQQLAVIDDLKEEYHDKKPSLWERFYEMIFGADENNPPLILLD
jgi:soluble cytochrome b562